MKALFAGLSNTPNWRTSRLMSACRSSGMEVEYNQLSQNGDLQGLEIENVFIEQLDELPPTFPEPATDPWEEQV